jgi:hypothetical protein
MTQTQAGAAASSERPSFAKKPDAPKRIRRTKAEIEAAQGDLLAKATANAQGDRVKIIIEENENIPPTGLALGHNGDQVYVVPGEVVNIPRKFLGVLDDAVESVSTTDPITKQVTMTRDRRRFPYRIVG